VIPEGLFEDGFCHGATAGVPSADEEEVDLVSGRHLGRALDTRFPDAASQRADRADLCGLEWRVAILDGGERMAVFREIYGQNLSKHR
jgi:hypothetical protein